MGKYEDMLLKRRREEVHAAKDQDAVEMRWMDRAAYQEMTQDFGEHDQLITELDQQLEQMNQIRETGMPEQLTPVQQESGRYEDIGHFEKKARKSAAKESIALTNKAKQLQEKLRDKPEGGLTVSEDMQMTQYMEQAELESLKANGYKENDPRYLRTRLKYLRHAEVILENAFSSGNVTKEQREILIQSYRNIQSKIDNILQVQNLRERYSDGYRREVDRELEKPELSQEEAESLMKQSLELLKRDDIDLLSARVFSPKLVRVNERQAEEFLEAQNIQEERREETVHDEVQTQEGPRILNNPSPEDFPIEENEYTQLIDELLTEIRQYKDELGGSPNFGNAFPAYRDRKEKIFGYPMEAFEAFCQEHIKAAGNFFTRGFFKVLGMVGGIQSEVLERSKYETACLHLQSMKMIAQRKTALTELFTEAQENINVEGVADACNTFFADISRIPCHASDNSPEGVLSAVNLHLEMLQSLLSRERARGTMKDFFSALHGVCFEDRTRILQEYYEAHREVSEGLLREVPQDEGRYYVRNALKAPQYDASESYVTAASRWVDAIRKDNELDDETPLTMEDILPCLIHEMVGKTYMDADDMGDDLSDTVTVTEEMLRSSKFKNIFIDVLWLLVEEEEEHRTDGSPSPA